MYWIVLSLFSALLFSFNELVRKEALRKMPLYAYILTASVFEAIIILPILSFFADLSVAPSTLSLIAINAILGSVSFWLIIDAFKKWEVSRIAPLENLNPLFLAALSFLILGEALSQSQAIGLLLIVLGTVILELEEHVGLKQLLFPGNDRTLIFHMMAAMLIWSFMAIINREVLKTISPFADLFYLILFNAIAWLAWFAIYHRAAFSRIIPTLRSHSKYFVGTAVLDHTSYLLILFALSIPAALVSLVISIRRVSTVFTVFLGGELFHEHRLKQRVAACLVMLVGAYLIAF